VPDYAEVIAHPMDFRTMRRRLEDGAYDGDAPLAPTTDEAVAAAAPTAASVGPAGTGGVAAGVAAMEEDFYLIVNNCLRYNAQGTPAAFLGHAHARFAHPS
jgi:hypothetical protein